MRACSCVNVLIENIIDSHLLVVCHINVSQHVSLTQEGVTHKWLLFLYYYVKPMDRLSIVSIIEAQYIKW